jgi:hypothetical protein
MSISRAFIFAAFVFVVLALPAVRQDKALLNTPDKLTWGRDGHTITGLIAQQFLTNASVEALNIILADYDGQLSHVVNWADEIKGNSAYAWSKPLHFINTPDW